MAGSLHLCNRQANADVLEVLLDFRDGQSTVWQYAHTYNRTSDVHDVLA